MAYTRSSQSNFVDQDVTSGSAPVLAVTNMTGSAAGLDSDATTHAAATGASHTYIDQDVTSGASPTFDGTNVTGLRKSIFTSTADATVANTTSATTIIGTGVGTTTLGAGALGVGSAVYITIRGHVSDTANPTLDILCSLGGTTVCSTGAITIGNISSDYFEVKVEIVCRTTGASGTVVASGEFAYENSNVMDGGGMVKAAATTIDTTGTLAIAVTAQWGTASASNTITGQVVSVETLN